MLKLIQDKAPSLAGKSSQVVDEVQLGTDRYDWVDAARGLGILLVIFIHVSLSLRNACLLPAGGVWSDVAFAALTFAMPLFILLVGLFVQRRLTRGVVAFLRPMGVTIIWPYLLWGSFILIAEWLGRDIRSPVDTSSVDVTLLWTPIAWLWFLWALGIYHLIAAAIGRFTILLIAVGLVALVGDGLTRLPPFAHQLAHFLIFYALGVALGPRIVRHILPLRVGILAAILFVPLVWIAAVSGPDPWSFATTGAAMVGVTAAISASQACRSNTMLLYLGRRSMPLYICHIFFITSVRIALSSGFGITEFAVLFPVCLAAAICGPLLLLRVSERCNMVALMGFGRPRLN